MNIQSFHLNKIQNYRVIFIILSILLFTYQNFLMAIGPLVGDDLYNSLLKGGMRLNDWEWFSHTFNMIKGWAFDNFRITFTSVIFSHAFYFFLQSPEEIRIAHFILNFIMCILFGFLVYLIFKKNFFVSIFSFSIISIFFQYRNWHDPFLLFPHTYHVLLILFFSSLILFYFYLEKKKFFNLFLSLFLYFLCCGTFEPALFLSPAYIFLSKYYDKKINQSLYFVSISLLFLLASIYLRFFLHDNLVGYDGSEISIDIFKNIKTLVIQISASIPLSFAFTKFDFAFASLDFYFLFFISIFLFIVLSILKKEAKVINYNVWLFLFGLTLVVSGAPIALSGKYIRELDKLGFGYGYINVLIQYFGFFFMFIFFLNILIRKSYKFILIFSILLGLTSFLNLGSNRHLTDSKGYSKVFRQNIINSFRGGILDSIPNYSNFVFPENRYELWKRSEIFANSTEKFFFVANGFNQNLFDMFINEGYLDGIYSDSPYPLSKLKIQFDSKISRYKFIKDPAKLNYFKNKKISNESEKKIINSSNQVYTLFNFPNFKDNRVLIARISSFNTFDNKLNEIFVDQIHIYSEKKKKTQSFNLKNEINLKKFLFINDLHNPNIKINNSLFEKINDINHQKINFYEKTNDKISSNLYNGSLDCELYNVEITDFNIVRRKPNFEYQRIIFNLKNLSTEDWDINNLSKKNPITLGAYIKNSKNNRTEASLRFPHYRFLIESGYERKIIFNFSDLFEIKDKLLAISNYSDYDKLVFTLIHEGKQYFPSNFKNCEIDINFKNKSKRAYFSNLNKKIRGKVY